MLVRGCDKQLTSTEFPIYRGFRTRGKLLPGLAKGYKLAGEQKLLERSAKDCDSQVRQAVPTFLLLGAVYL
jgi:hypothetical protein